MYEVASRQGCCKGCIDTEVGACKLMQARSRNPKQRSRTRSASHLRTWGAAWPPGCLGDSAAEAATAAMAATVATAVRRRKAPRILPPRTGVLSRRGTGRAAWVEKTGGGDGGCGGKDGDDGGAGGEKEHSSHLLHLHMLQLDSHGDEHDLMHLEV